LTGQPGVLAAEPSGDTVHVFIDEKATSIEKLASLVPFRYERIVPSLEDVFIALVRKQEAQSAA